MAIPHEVISVLLHPPKLWPELYGPGNSLEEDLQVFLRWKEDLKKTKDMNQFFIDCDELSQRK